MFLCIWFICTGGLWMWWLIDYLRELIFFWRLAIWGWYDDMFENAALRTIFIDYYFENPFVIFFCTFCTCEPPTFNEFQLFIAEQVLGLLAFIFDIVFKTFSIRLFLVKEYEFGLRLSYVMNLTIFKCYYRSVYC